MKWRANIIFGSVILWIALYINSFFIPEPYGGLNTLISIFYHSEFIHDELTYFYRYYYSTSVVIAISRVLLFTLPLFTPYLAMRLYNKTYFQGYIPLTQIALVVSFLPMVIGIGELCLDAFDIHLRSFLVS
jgi:hypothetical protein